MEFIDLKQQQDDAYRAIGRYVVGFSRLIATMRRALLAEIGTNLEDRQVEVLSFGFGEITAEPIAQAFFAMCRTTRVPDKYEEKVERVLREKHVGIEIRRRNALAHGDWVLPRWAYDHAPSWNALLVRVKTSNRANPFQSEELSAADLDNEARRVEALEWMIWEFGEICSSERARATLRDTSIRVRDAFEVVGSSKEPRVQFRQGYKPSISGPPGDE